MIDYVYVRGRIRMAGTGKSEWVKPRRTHGAGGSGLTWLASLSIALIVVIAGAGLLSFPAGAPHETLNQYGESIQMWGGGVYEHDSYFKATIFIGTDCAWLLVVVPFAVKVVADYRRRDEMGSRINLLAFFSLALYYAVSMSFGVTFNELHLLYTALLSLSFFGTVTLSLSLLRERPEDFEYATPKGAVAFLVITGSALLAAWLPDIVGAYLTSGTLDLIEVYTTEVTYVVDMGIIAPLMFLTIGHLRRRTFTGYVLLRLLLRVCLGVGVVLVFQTVVQMLGRVDLPVQAVISKTAIFVILALCAVLIDKKIHVTEKATNAA
ncbi:MULTISPECIES: hypothetical protein [unclassified Actinomyces]|uniref:hypothetical protein n=1 Tax=unclassified Actinomyces TaxID=2609248 RepID=UPI000D598010|nr:MULTISPECIES: hypothetical protein [unclassified Actinomyces]RAX23811.1 hypothetical protein DRB07_02610 [Actinomyces sp. Z3]